MSSGVTASTHDRMVSREHVPFDVQFGAAEADHAARHILESEHEGAFDLRFRAVQFRQRHSPALQAVEFLVHQTDRVLWMFFRSVPR